jgi:hypothetical protein
MKLTVGFVFALLLSACAQVSSDLPPLTASNEQRCKEFRQIANDMTSTAYRRAAAGEQLRALRCNEHQ